MRVLIIEDEDLAAWGLISKLQRLDPAIEVLATLDTVSGAVEWFRNNPAPDLAFFDIQLADGLSFEIFEQVKVACPIIFTTAYDA
ncbi:MAG TPA: DNA-binding response regulator, partial [Saprospiraceae bacterium]|nr:DNA-binding response regulator [Saprospiraceae bacterium]